MRSSAAAAGFLGQPVVAPLRLFDDDDEDAPAQRAITLLLQVAAHARVSSATKYCALSLLADRALPELAQAAAAPSLIPLALACLLVASKLHEREHLRVSKLLASASAVAPEVALRVRPVAITSAEIWLVLHTSCGGVALLSSDYVAEILAALCEAGVAPQGGRYFGDVALEACDALLDALYERPRCRGLLTTGGPGFAAAIITAAAALLVPPAERARHAPTLAWLAGLAGERAEDVQAVASEVLRCVLQDPRQDDEN